MWPSGHSLHTVSHVIEIKLIIHLVHDNRILFSDNVRVLISPSIALIYMVILSLQTKPLSASLQMSLSFQIKCNLTFFIPFSFSV